MNTANGGSPIPMEPPRSLKLIGQRIIPVRLIPTRPLAAFYCRAMLWACGPPAVPLCCLLHIFLSHDLLRLQGPGRSLLSFRRPILEDDCCKFRLRTRLPQSGRRPTRMRHVLSLFGIASSVSVTVAWWLPSLDHLGSLHHTHR